MMKMKGCAGHMIAMVLVVVGAINWGLVGAFEWNLVNAILGSLPLVERIVYVLVGLAGIMMLFGCKCKKCMAACGKCKGGSCKGGSCKGESAAGGEGSAKM